MASKLTDEDRKAIHEAWKDGETPKQLAERFGVGKATIYNTITRMNASIEDLTGEKTEAEQTEVKAEPQKIPDIIWNALDDQCHALNLEIEERELRIAELKEEIAALEDKRYAIEEWMEKHT